MYTEFLYRIWNFLFLALSLPTCSVPLLSNCDISGLFSFFKPVSVSSKQQYEWETHPTLLPCARYRLPSKDCLFGVTLEQNYPVEFSPMMEMFHICTTLVAASHVWLLSREILLCATGELNLHLCFISVCCHSDSPVLPVAAMLGHHSTRASSSCVVVCHPGFLAVSDGAGLTWLTLPSAEAELSWWFSIA